MSEGSPRRYPAELRSCAVRMVAEARHEYPSEWAAFESVGFKLGIGMAQKVQRERISTGRSVTAKPAPTWRIWAGLRCTTSPVGGVDAEAV